MPRKDDVVLWTLAKNGQQAQAVLRHIEDVGAELRLLWSGDLRYSQVYIDMSELQTAAAEKRRELEDRGWTAMAAGG